MRAVIQRVQQASVNIGHRESGKIGPGLLVFLGVEDADQQEDLDWLVRKILNLRIFNDEQGLMNYSLQDTQGSLLLVSQFTLHANVKKGNRPSYNRASKPELAKQWYDKARQAFESNLNKQRLASGEFGADMQVQLINDGPVTIWIDTKNKE